MKPIFAALLLSGVALAGCSAEAPAPTETATEQVAEVQPVAVIEGEPTGPVYTKTAGDKLALSGYDAVSYFQGDGTPKEGKADTVVLYQGYEYRFANVDNAKEFAANPAKYVPAYGGNCAWAAANSKLAPGNPQNYKIVDGKLYLNFNDTVQETWEKDIPGFIEKAEVEYPKFGVDERYDDSN